jgi:hypothetical protein
VAVPKAFRDAVERKEVMSLTTRPQDLAELVEFWNKHERIGSRLELLRSSIDRRLEERDQDRSELRPIAIEKLRFGARLVAAAATLTGESSIRVPDGTSNSKGISIRDVLPDWDDIDCATLLSRPIFDKRPARPDACQSSRSLVLGHRQADGSETRPGGGRFQPRFNLATGRSRDRNTQVHRKLVPGTGSGPIWHSAGRGARRRKKTDLRFHGAVFDGPVRAELKLADKWTGPHLFERLEVQLCGDYLRDKRSSRGIFLLGRGRLCRNCSLVCRFALRFISAAAGVFSSSSKPSPATRIRFLNSLTARISSGDWHPRDDLSVGHKLVRIAVEVLLAGALVNLQLITGRAHVGAGGARGHQGRGSQHDGDDGHQLVAGAC